MGKKPFVLSCYNTPMTQWHEIGRYGAYDQLFQHDEGWLLRISLTPEGDLLARLSHIKAPNQTQDEICMKQAQAHEWPVFFSLATGHFDHWIYSPQGQACLGAIQTKNANSAPESTLPAD